MVRRALSASYLTGRKIVVAVLGATVLALGVVMIVLPGPAVLVIPLGLGILAAESRAQVHRKSLQLQFRLRSRLTNG